MLNKNFFEEGKENPSGVKDEDLSKVKSLGGLFIVGTERHESRRIDNQLRGRSGRQGDPGSSIFYISLEDELMRIFGGESIDGMLKKLGLKENEAIDHPWLNKAMARAQEKVEGRNFDIRKTLIKFDDVMNDQRQVIFSQRLNILRKDDIKDIIENFIDEITNDITKIKKEYNTSNDNKAYLAGIKYFIGGSIKDDDLIKISSYNDLKFVGEIKNFYLKLNTRKIRGLKIIFYLMNSIIWCLIGLGYKKKFITVN